MNVRMQTHTIRENTHLSLQLHTYSNIMYAIKNKCVECAGAALPCIGIMLLEAAPTCGVTARFTRGRLSYVWRHTRSPDMARLRTLWVSNYTARVWLTKYVNCFTKYFIRQN